MAERPAVAVWRGVRVAVGGMIAWRLAAPGLALGAPALPEVWVSNPASFGFQVGDVVQRELHLSLPVGSRFDAASLPPPTRHGAALELSSVEHDGADDAPRQTVRLRYQIFRSPPDPAVLEMPVIALRFIVPRSDGQAREMVARVDAHPLMVSPLAPAQPPNRAGLGPLQADLPTPLLLTDPLRMRAMGCALLAGWAAAWLAWRHALRPLWLRRQRPFARAWRDIRRELAGAGHPAGGNAVAVTGLASAMRRLHAALREDAGRVVLAADLPGWLAQRPRYADLGESLRQFHALSERYFFARGAVDDPACRPAAQHGGDGAASVSAAGAGAGAGAGTVAAADVAALRALSSALARREAQA